MVLPFRLHGPSPREFKHARKQLSLLLFSLSVHSLALSGVLAKEILQTRAAA